MVRRGYPRQRLRRQCDRTQAKLRENRDASGRERLPCSGGTSAAALPYHQRRCKLPLPRRRTRQLREQTVDQRFACVDHRRAHGAKWRLKIGGGDDVVVADDAHVVRHFFAERRQRTDRVHRHRVGGGENAVEPAVAGIALGDHGDHRFARLVGCQGQVGGGDQPARVVGLQIAGVALTDLGSAVSPRRLPQVRHSLLAC